MESDDQSSSTDINERSSQNKMHYAVSSKRKFSSSFILKMSCALVFIVLGMIYITRKPPEIQVDPIYELEMELRRNFTKSPHKLEASRVKEYYFTDISKAKVELKSENNLMLIGILVPPLDFQRRALMRTHQIRPFRNYSISFKFFMGESTPALQEALEFENQTYGDLIILKGIKDNLLRNESRKVFEFFKYVEHNMDVYKYIAKLDTDCYLNVAGLWDYHFNKEVQDLEFGIISRFRQNFAPFDFPQGGFVALSWKSLLMLNKLYEFVPLSTKFNEDAQLAWYFHDAEIKLTQIELTHKQAYDFRPDVILSNWKSTDVSYEAIQLHILKTDHDYLNVASCFSSRGINVSQVNHMREINWTRIT
jgi:hypothetical protein